MRRLFIVTFISASLASCGPPLVWGGNEATKGRLLDLVPIGSPIKFLEAEAEFRNWRVSNQDDRTFEKGLPHFFGVGCEHQGGVSMTVIVAEYGVLTTSVETAWLFDEDGKLGELCIRRTIDAP
jgi:hypothetical protein